MPNIAKQIKNKKKDAKKKLQKISVAFLNQHYINLHNRKHVQEHMAYLESRDGNDFTGNIFRIARELSIGDYGINKIVVHVKPAVLAHAKSLAASYGMKNILFVTKMHVALAYMQKAKYIVSDSGVPWKYVKRHDQIVLNTWHGTPLKHMGKRIKDERHAIGTVQHFMLSSDYLLFPSEYMRDIMLDDYMIRNVASGTVLLGGYPRNEAFYDAEVGERLKERFGLNGKRCYAYLPTWRGAIKNMNPKVQAERFANRLAEIDAFLEDDQIIYAKLHPLVNSGIDFVQFVHIKPFPTNVDMYDFLQATDCLITDYSSIFFDYANSRKKIILYCYDKDEYLEDRGLYLGLDELPFPIVQTTQDLIREMDSPKNYDDATFLARFCGYDGPGATSALCRHVFLNSGELKSEHCGNGRDNVLIMGGGLSKNGITTALVNLLRNLDTEEKNYFVSFRRWEIDADPSRLDVIPEQGFNLLPLMSKQMMGLRERKEYKSFRLSKQPLPMTPAIEALLKREVDRCFYGASFDQVIQFDGYNDFSILLFTKLKANDSAIWVHNDMVREITVRHNQSISVLKYAYSNYDSVAVVSEELIPSVTEISDGRANIKVVHNFHDHAGVCERACQTIEFEPATDIVCWNPAGIMGMLQSPGPKILNIGRFSVEKGHMRLLQAFDEYLTVHPNAQLIIIGGNGADYNKTVRYARSLWCWDHVALIKNMINPMPILARCDLFYLSSFHEGLPIVLFEAASLGIPCISSDIPGPHSFMARHGGTLVASSDEGIREGFRLYDAGEVEPLDLDFEEYNATARREFLSLFKEDD